MRIARKVWVGLASIPLLMLSANLASAGAQPQTLVYLNGAPSSVSFNDGDSFRIIQGNPKGSQARLSGFNTLETHGPVHQWGGWHFKELYAIAKMATMNGRRGVWHCEGDYSADGYGRLLWNCLDLAEDQIRKGLAHAMSVTDEPAHPRLVAAQQDAIRNRRGIWAKGVPTYIMTSLHSADEPGAKPGKNYNRLVNTMDGHTKKWIHFDKYKECEVVCHRPTELTQSEALRVVAELRADPETAPLIEGIDDLFVAVSVNTFVQNGFVPKIFGVNNDKFEAALGKVKDSGRFASASPQQASCGVHVLFERRYKRPRPSCLKW